MKSWLWMPFLALFLFLGPGPPCAAHETEELEASRAEMKRYEQVLADYKRTLIQYEELLQEVSRCRHCTNRLRAAEQAAAQCSGAGPVIRRGSDAADSTEQIVPHATSVLMRLQAKDYDSIISEFHYPPEYTSEQIAEDRDGLLKALSLLMEEFGALETYAIATEPIPVYQVGLTAGSVEYWTKFPNNGISFGVSFLTRHSRISAAILQQTYHRFNGQLRLRSIDFAIPTSAQGARDRILEVTKKLGSLVSAPKQRVLSVSLPDCG